MGNLQRRDINYHVNVLFRRFIMELDAELMPESGADWAAILNQIETEVQYKRETKSA